MCKRIVLLACLVASLFLTGCYDPYRYGHHGYRGHYWPYGYRGHYGHHGHHYSYGHHGYH
jgi:hypothetical protein